VGQDLTNAWISYNYSSSTLTNATFTGAIVAGAEFSESNLASSQLYSTASYQAKNLQGIGLQRNNLASWNFAGQNLTGANFNSAIITGADLTGADLRGAKGFSANMLQSATTNSTISPYGIVSGLHLDSTKPTFLVRNFSGNIPIHVTQGMSMTSGTSIVFQLDNSSWGSTISFDYGTTVALAGNLELTFAEGVLAASLRGQTFQLFSWAGVSPSGQFGQISGDLPPNYYWDTSELYSSGTVTLVPEPSTFVLIGIGVLGLLAYAWRRRIA
jgi:uncharacterized protein YjbI with pentapeptide repeats